MLPLITLEEHYMSSVEGADFSTQLPAPPTLLSKLRDLGAGRIQDLDDGHVSLQVLSHSPFDATLSQSRQANDELAAAICQNPSRLAGFALLPLLEPSLAAGELTRCVKEHGFVGALIDNHTHGEFYDDPKFWPIFAAAQELDVPIYIHPTWAADAVMDHYRGNYPESTAKALSQFGFGWHADTALTFLRLFAAGLFDAYPRLRIILGHMGELLPFTLERTIASSARWAAGRRRGLRQVWRENVWVTTSGMFSLAPLACLLQTTGADRVLYSVDYPFSATTRGAEFVEEVRASGLLSAEQMEAFAYGNAERLLKVKVRREGS